MLFVRIPPERLTAWSDAVGLHLSAKARICTRHFTDRDYNRGDRTAKLLFDAVPSLNLEVSDVISRRTCNQGRI